jgi:hypothetical protein
MSGPAWPSFTASHPIFIATHSSLTALQHRRVVICGVCRDLPDEGVDLLGLNVVQPVNRVLYLPLVRPGVNDEDLHTPLL